MGLTPLLRQCLTQVVPTSKHIRHMRLAKVQLCSLKMSLKKHPAAHIAGGTRWWKRNLMHVKVQHHHNIYGNYRLLRSEEITRPPLSAVAAQTDSL